MSNEKEKFHADLAAVLEDVMGMLLEKNRKYGDAALSPAGVFSKITPEQAIRVRMDDKLARIKNRQDDDSEDAERDLLGYLVLLAIAKRRQAAEGGQP